MKPKKSCSFPGCGNTVELGVKWCEYHVRQYDKKRGSSYKRGYDARWQKARLLFLAEHPLCRFCGQAATVVDHIKPHRGDYDKFWDEDNWEALCTRCHNRKTAKGL